MLDCRQRIARLAEASGVEIRKDDEAALAALARPLRLVALGEVNAGKSTLLNAIAGLELCEAGPLPTTQRTSWFRYGETAGERERRNGWREVLHSQDFLRRFELIDTPGTNSGWRESVMTELPRFQQADLLLVVFPAANTWTAATWDLVSALSDEALERTLLVVQQADQKSIDDLQVIRGHMTELCEKKVGSALPILSVAAQLALEAKLEPQTARKGWSASGFLGFETFLSEQVCESEMRRHLLLRTAQEGARCLREIEDSMDRQRRGMDDDGWFLGGLEKESEQLRDLVLDGAPQALGGVRGRYEAEVRDWSKSLGRKLGVLPTLWRLFMGDGTPAKVEVELASRLDGALRDFAQTDAARLMEECEGHWSEVRPRVKERMGMDTGNSSIAGEAGLATKEKFVERIGMSASAVMGNLRVRASLDEPIRHRNDRLKWMVGIVLVLLAASGGCGVLNRQDLAIGLAAGAGVLALLSLLAIWATGHRVVTGLRRRLRDSIGQFEEAVAGYYAEAVRGLFRDYSNGLLAVKRKLAERKASLEPRAERWNALYLELKTIEQDLEE